METGRLEAARLLRPERGRLHFLNERIPAHALRGRGRDEARARTPAAARVRRLPDGMAGRLGGIEFHLAHGDWVRLLRASGFEIEDSIQVRLCPEGATTDSKRIVTPDWARKWPTEETEGRYGNDEPRKRASRSG